VEKVVTNEKIVERIVCQPDPLRLAHEYLYGIGRNSDVDKAITIYK
jgi:hypothetical protein